MAKLPSLHMTKSELNTIILQNIIASGIMLDVGTLENNIMTERTKIINEHQKHHSIWQNKTTGKWHTKLGSDKHMLVRKEREDLENAIVEFYLTNHKKYSTFSDVFLDWVEYMKLNQTHAMKTINEYCTEYNRFLKQLPFTSLPIAQITEMDVVRLLKDIIYKGTGISQKRFSSVKTIIRAVFNHARIEQNIECITVKNIMDEIRFPSSAFTSSTVHDSEQVFKNSEIMSIKKHLAGTNNLLELGILLTIDTGLRIGELVALKREDIKGDILRIERSEHKARFDDGFKYYIDKPKKNKCRDVILTKNAKATIEQVLSLHNSEWLFPSETDMNSWNRTYNFDKAIRRICRELNIKERSMHKLRKTYSSKLLTCGVSDKLVQQQLGHADIKTTHQSYYYDIYDYDEKIETLNKIKIG